MNAGKDQTLTLPTSANLTGTAIDDGLPADTLTLTWSVFSGPGSVTFGSANAAATTAKFSVAGNYVLRLTADDGGVSSTDDVSIIVNDLLQNPSFDVDGNSDGRPDAWTSNAQFTRNGVAVQSGSYSGRHYSTTNSSYTIGQTVNNLTAGTNYNFSGWVNIPQTTDVFSLTLEVQWFNASNVLIGTATVWDNAKASLIAPTGTKYAKVNMVVSSLNATIYVDNFSFLPN